MDDAREPWIVDDIHGCTSVARAQGCAERLAHSANLISKSNDIHSLAIMGEAFFGYFLSQQKVSRLSGRDRTNKLGAKNLIFQHLPCF